MRVVTVDAVCDLFPTCIVVYGCKLVGGDGARVGTVCVLFFVAFLMLCHLQVAGLMT